MIKQKILLATDHAGFEIKEEIKIILKKNNLEFEDYGALKYNKTDDYPDFISKVSKKISENPDEFLGIILGGSGQGEAIVANRFSNIRAIVYYGGSYDILTLSKEHNNANILSLGARFIKKKDLEKIILIWIQTKFTNENRHLRRIKKIEKLI